MDKESISITPITLLDLPTELISKIFSLLPISTILNLSSSCKYLKDVLSENELCWKEVFELIIKDNLLNNKSISIDNQIMSFKDQAKFAIINSKSLGFFVASTGRSRVVRVAMTGGVTGDQLTLNCSELRVQNAFTSITGPMPALELPYRAQYDPIHAAYFEPDTGPYSPTRGLATQVLEIDLQSRPLFDITSTDGAVLHLPTTTDGPVKLKLLPVVQTVSMKEQDEQAQSTENQRLRLVRMFTGVRPTPRVFPSKHLVENGVIRGLNDWTHERGSVKEVLVEDRLEGGKVGRCEGFRVEIRRAIVPPPLDPGVASVISSLTSGRRGVPRNGGPAILWNGSEIDPHQFHPNATLISTEFGGTGFTFRMNYDGDAPLVPNTIPTTINGQRLNTPDPESVIPTPLSREIFFPINRPNRPFSSLDLSSVDSSGEILAESLTGLWTGTYGPHGAELSYVSVQHFITTNQDDGRAVYGRTLSCVKVTGDDNVPAGELTWKADLAPLELSSPETPLNATIPTILNSTLLRWSTYNPLTQGSQASEVPDWDQGTAIGKGRIAGSLFTDPSWVEAHFVFIRSKNEFTEIEENGEEVTKNIDSVEEIRVRWLGSVATFKRVRI